MTQLGFVIMYPRDVANKMAFYERAFGMQTGALADQAVYGEMLGGDVKLQFVQEEFARHYVPDFVRQQRDHRESTSLPGQHEVRCWDLRRFVQTCPKARVSIPPNRCSPLPSMTGLIALTP